MRSNQWVTATGCADATCVEANWQVASGCADTTCVEVSPGDNVVLVRDSKARDGGTLCFPAEVWAAFTDDVKNDRLLMP